MDLILLNGDVHPNPGPDSVTSLADLSVSNSVNSFSALANHLSIMHLNIQSILPKLDLIKCESLAYDVLVFSESWLKPVTANDKLLIEAFHPPFRADRIGRPGGGVIIYVRQSLVCKRRNDLEINNLEAVWLEICVRSKKILIGGFYRPPNSTADYFTILSESIDRAYNTTYQILL